MCRVFHQKFSIWENIISSIIYKEKNSEKPYTPYTQMAESLENTGLEGCVGFILNHTQTIHKTRFLKILKKFQKKYCKVFYNVILYSCSKERRKIKEKRKDKKMKKQEKLEINRLGLMKEYRHLNQMKLTLEVSNRMSDIYLILIDKYNMSASEIEALEQ